MIGGFRQFVCQKSVYLKHPNLHPEQLFCANKIPGTLCAGDLKYATILLCQLVPTSQLDCENLFLRQEIEKSLRVVKPTLNKYLRRLVINCLLVWKTTELRWTQQLQAYCLVGAKIL